MLLPIGVCPEDNSILILIKQETDRFLNENSDKTYNELNDLLIEHLVHFVVDNMELIEKDYPDGIANIQFMKDMNSYLFHKSKNI